MEIISDNNPSDLAVLEIDVSVDLNALAKQAVDSSDADELEEPEVPPTASTCKHPLQDSDMDEPPAKRAAIPDQPPKAQSSNNRRRARRRAQKLDSLGHPRGSGLAFQKYLLNTVPICTEMQSKALPIAEGGWVATNASYYGAKTKRTVESMKEMGFTHIPWKGR